MMTYTYLCEDCKIEFDSESKSEKYCSACGSENIVIIDEETIETDG